MRRNLQVFLGLIVVLALWAACRKQPPPKDEVGQWIRLEESSQGCFHGDERRVSWTRRGNQFLSKESSTILSVSQVERIRRAVRESSRGRSHFAEEIGLTPQSLKAHQPDLLKSVELSELPPGMAGHMEYATVLARAQRMAFDGESTTRTRYKLELDGEPRITVEFGGGCEYAYPWSVVCGLEQWDTCSSSMVDQLLPTTTPESPSRWLFQCSRDWRRFWNPESVVGQTLWRDFTRESQEYRAQEIVRRAPGYQSLASVLHIESIRSWPVNPDGSHGYYEFSVIDKRDLDLFDWDAQEDHWTLPQATSVFRQACAEVRRHPWLKRWRAQAKGRQLRLCVKGARPLEMDFYSLQPWERSGLPGKPEFQIDLLQNEEKYARVYLSSSTDQTLMTERGEHFYHPTTPNVILIDLQGNEHKARALGGSPTKEYD